MGEALRLDRIGLIVRPHFWSRPKTLLSDVSLSVSAGQSCALLGQNGAGKTTLMRVLLGLVRATHGHGHIGGASLGRAESRARLGFLPERPALPLECTPMEFVAFAARQSGLVGHAAHRAATRQLERLGLGADGHQRMRHFSKGMQQKVGLAQAMVHEPDVLVLDEPLSGLDPPARRDVRQLLQQERDRGAAVIFSTHILADIASTCDRVAVLVGGRLAYFDAPMALMTEAERRGGTIVCDLTVGGLPDAHLLALCHAHGATCMGAFAEQSRLRVPSPKAARALVADVVAAGGEIVSLERDVRALEQLLAGPRREAPCVRSA